MACFRNYVENKRKHHMRGSPFSSIVAVGIFTENDVFVKKKSSKRFAEYYTSNLWLLVDCLCGIETLHRSQLNHDRTNGENEKYSKFDSRDCNAHITFSDCALLVYL